MLEPALTGRVPNTHTRTNKYTMAGKGWSIITETSSTGLNKSTRKPLHELQHVSSCKQEQIYVSVMNCDIFMGMNVHCWCVYIWYFNTEIDLLFICCPKPKSSRNVHFEPELCWTAKCFSKYSAEEGAKCHRGTSCALVQLPTVKGFHHFTGSLLLRLAACHCCVFLTMTMEAGRESGRKQDAIFGQWKV